MTSAQATGRWFLTTMPQIEPRVILLVVDQVALLCTYILPLPEACDDPEQAAQYHILSLYVWGFIR
jgi:hypothetical protein